MKKKKKLRRRSRERSRSQNIIMQEYKTTYIYERMKKNEI